MVQLSHSAKPIQLKQQAIKSILQLSSKVCYGKEPHKGGGGIPQHLRVSSVSNSLLPVKIPQ